MARRKRRSIFDPELPEPVKNVNTQPGRVDPDPQAELRELSRKYGFRSVKIQGKDNSLTIKVFGTFPDINNRQAEVILDELGAVLNNHDEYCDDED